MTTISQTIPSLGSPPLTTDPANFDTRADTLYGTSLPAVITATNTWSGQANTVAGEVNTNATTATTARIAAEAAEAAAEAAQAAAQSASNATQWVSGQAYVAGNVVWSPSTYLSYRAVGATSGTTDPSQSASWVLLAVDVRRFTNPLAQAVSVQMTAAASGTTAIRQLNNANLNLGTNDFTLVWKGSLPDWTPATAVRCMQKRVDDGTRWLFSINTDGTLNFSNIVAFSNTYQATATAANTLANNTCAEIAIVVVRETVSAAGSATFYVNGVQLGAAVSITAAATSNLDNTGTLHLNSLNTTSDGRAASNSLGWSIFNRALTSAEVLDLSINGVALADRGASQTPVYTSNFSAGVDSWTTITNVTVTGNVDSIDGQDDWLEVEKTVTSGAMRISRAITTSGTRTIKGRIFNPVGSGITHFRIANDTDAGGNLVSTTFALAEGQAIDIVRTFVADSTSALSVRVVNSNGSNGTAAVGAKFYIKNWVVGNAGLVSELIASNAQSNTGQIFDTSGNKNHALLPASGATVVGRPVSQTREVRWTNTWAGTNELQYIGGVNQAILPANAYIESIVGTVSGATPHDIIVGDGSDADRYVTITTGLAAGTTSFTLAARTTDGTNLKLTVDPDTNSDMSIAWVIKYTTLES